MPVDTIAVAWDCEHLTEDDMTALLERYPTARFTSQRFYEGCPYEWRGIQAYDDKLGRIQYAIAGDDITFRAETSLGRFMCGTNLNSLTVDQAESGLGEYMETVEKSFPVDSAHKEVRRIDFFHQMEVPDSRVLLSELRKLWAGTVCYDSGLQVHNRKNWMSRMYDKGIEAKDPSFFNTVRSEEQLRKGDGGLGGYIDIHTGKLNVEKVVEIMNAKYGDDDAVIECVDRRDYAKSGVTGMVLLALESHPELMDDFKDAVNYRTHKKYVGLLGSLVMRRHKVNLRVTEEMLRCN